jgi:nucleoside-diphosphate-sugar epimerase
MIYLTGASGFVGGFVLSYFGHSNIIEYKRNSVINLESASVVIHLAGKSDTIKKKNSPEDYYKVNTEFTKEIFDSFLISKSEVFIFLSSVKAVADILNGELTELNHPNPPSHYGKSKLEAEQYILSKSIPLGKRVYIIRSCVIYGPNNKGNLNLLYKVMSFGLPWPLGAFSNKRSFCSIDNLMFVFKELIERDSIPSGIYNMADDEALSTNDLIELIAQSRNKKPKIWNIPKELILKLVGFGDKLQLPLNTERLNKLTLSYVVSNAKIKAEIGKSLPVSSRKGLLSTFKSFNL